MFPRLRRLLQAHNLGRHLMAGQTLFQPQARLRLPRQYPQLLLVHQSLA